MKRNWITIIIFGCLLTASLCKANSFKLYVYPIPENGTQGKITLPTNVSSVAEFRSNLPVHVVLSTVIKAEPAEGYQLNYWEKIKGEQNVLIVETNNASTIVTYPGTNDVHIAAYFCKTSTASTNTVDVDIEKEIKKQEIHLQKQRMEFANKFMRLNYKIREIRDRAVKQDRELKSMQTAKENKQNELENRLLQKYPEIQKLEDEKKEVSAQLSEIDKKLQEIRSKTKTDAQ